MSPRTIFGEYYTLSSPAISDGQIFIRTDKFLYAIPATGNVLNRTGSRGRSTSTFASPVGADGKVFLVSQDGTASVVDAKGDWEILSVNPLDDEVFATPAIADSKIYVRTKSTLYAFAAPSH